MPGFNSNTFKIFIGKIPDKTTVQDIRPLFEKHGKVVECDVVKNYGFVHMDDPVAGYEAIRNLNGSVINGVAITVEEAKSRKRSSATTTKIFVSNIAANVKAEDIKALFSKFGSVAECDLVRTYGFVHIDTPNLTELLKELNGYEIGGQPLKVQISTSRIRQRPGMGNSQQCYKCGLSGHWSKECTQSSPISGALNHFHYNMTDTMHGMHVRSSYPRELYQPPSSFMRDRIINGYSVPDMREYYEHYCQNALEQYEDYNMMSSKRDNYNNITRPSNAADYAMFSRRSPNSNIAHYTANNGNYNEYGGAISYTYSSDPYFSYGDYSSTAMVSNVAAERPFEACVMEGARNDLSEERRSERRDGTSRSSSRYAPY